MPEVLYGVAVAAITLLNQMSPYLLLGLLFAGLLHIFFSVEWISTHLGKANVGSVTKAVLFGIPLPLCSCSVIPAAVSLRKMGASRGSVISFLIATPITGVDSIFATYSLLGFFFTVYRLLASAIAAFVAGLLTNLLTMATPQSGEDQTSAPKSCHDAVGEAQTSHGRRTLGELFHYAFVQLLGEIWKPLFIGVLVGGLITYAIPDHLITRYLGSTWQAMLVMLVVGIPMYVCSTGSIPIAAALLLKGMSPGAALVFLLAGPATNAVTITVVAKDLGKTVAVIYVATIAVMSVLLGIGMNALFLHLDWQVTETVAPMTMLPKWLEWLSTATLLLATLWLLLRQKRK